MPVSGGPETLVLDRNIYPHHWDLADRGIYFIGSSAEAVAAICFYDFATQTTRTLAPVHTDPAFGLTDGLSASPDGKWLLYAGGIYTSDIMLIQNFR